jgi:hypothetical protein
VSELDLSARHAWLVTTGRERVERIAADPEYYDAKVAGWWVWGLCSWIGSGWCKGEGPWVVGPDGVLIKGNAGQGINRQMPHLGNAGRGINRQMPHLGAGQGINRQMPHLGNAGRGINRKMPHLGNPGQGILDTMTALSKRLRGVRVVNGNWDRILGPSSTRAGGVFCGVLLDPPYATGEDLYATEAVGVAKEVFAWAEEHGDDPALRIVVCGYEGDWEPPEGWQTVPWKAQRAYASKNDGSRERLWCSPACHRVGASVKQGTLFDEVSP